MPSQKRKKQKKPKALSKIQKRRNEIKDYLHRQLERIDPLEGMGFLGLTVAIYQGQCIIYEGLKNLMGMFGREEGELTTLGALALLSPAGYGIYVSATEGQKLAEQLQGLTKETALKILNKSKRTAEEESPNATEEDKEKFAMMLADLEAKFYKLMMAMGAAYCIITFLKSYEWSEAVENVPGINILGTGVSQ